MPKFVYASDEARDFPYIPTGVEGEFLSVSPEKGDIVDSPENPDPAYWEPVKKATPPPPPPAES